MCSIQLEDAPTALALMADVRVVRLQPILRDCSIGADSLTDIVSLIQLAELRGYGRGAS